MTVEQIDVLQLMWGNEIHVKSKCVLVMYFPHNSHAELITSHQYLFSHLPRGETHIKICNKQKIRVNLFLRHLCRQMHMKILFAFCTIRTISLNYSPKQKITKGLLCIVYCVFITGSTKKFSPPPFD